MSIERPNLAAAFKGKASSPIDRSSGLAGLLPPPRRASEPVTAPPAPGPVENTSSEDKAPSTSRKSRQATNAQQPIEVDDVNNVAVYLEPTLLALVKDARRVRGISYDQLTVEAFARVGDDALRAHFAQTEVDIAGEAMPSRRRRPRGISGIQIQLRLDSTQRAWLDKKREDVGAPSRSALVATALRLQLG